MTLLQNFTSDTEKSGRRTTKDSSSWRKAGQWPSAGRRSQTVSLFINIYLNPDIVCKGISLIPIVKQLSIVANQGCVRVASAAHQFLDRKMKILKASD